MSVNPQQYYGGTPALQSDVVHHVKVTATTINTPANLFGQEILLDTGSYTVNIDFTLNGTAGSYTHLVMELRRNGVEVDTTDWELDEAIATPWTRAMTFTKTYSNLQAGTYTLNISPGVNDGVGSASQVSGIHTMTFTKCKLYQSNA